MAKTRDYHDSVFFNCPYDTEYMPIFRAIIFTIYRCGFYPKSALEEDNAMNNRLDKIIRLVSKCRYGIHDISRTEMSKNGYPRFNMPFELGIFFGAQRLGSSKQRKKNAMIFERKPGSYQQYLSDLKGIDPKAHNNDPAVAMLLVRDWLRAASRRTTLPFPATLKKEFIEFEARLPAIVKELGFDMDKIPFNDFCVIVEKAVAQKVELNN